MMIPMDKLLEPTKVYEIDDVLDKVHVDIDNQYSKSLSTDLGLGKNIDPVYSNGGESKGFNSLVRLPIFPEWFFTARIGQPRKINYVEIRNFAQSPWVQMVMNAIKKQLLVTDYRLTKVDDQDENDYIEMIDKANTFLRKVNANKETINQLSMEGVTDICEIDALTWTKVYSVDSYEMKQVDVYNDVGDVVSTEERPVLKPFGQRKLMELRSADPATFLKQIDIYKTLTAFYQYSWKNPRSSPVRFEPDEIAYAMLNPRSYKVYGFSPVQAIQQVLELLIQATRYNKDFFKNNAIPDAIIGLPLADRDSLNEFKSSWNQSLKGKPHKLAFHNSDVKVEHFSKSNKDMEWLGGQKWYFHLVFAVFGLSPQEAGFYEDSNRSTSDSQERISVRNAIKPFFKLIEDVLNNDILPELFQQENLPIKFEFYAPDHVAEKIEFEQKMKEVELGAMTVNEYRASQGRSPVEWGDVPANKTAEPEESSEASPDKVDDNKQKSFSYSKAFERFVDNASE
jgi:HK97 family phage portal protein